MPIEDLPTEPGSSCQTTINVRLSPNKGADSDENEAEMIEQVAKPCAEVKDSKEDSKKVKTNM